MLFKDFKSRIINLGFEEDDAFEENPKHIIEATNRANVLLHQIVEPKEKVYSYTLSSDVAVYYEINLKEIIPGFVSKSNKPPSISGAPISNYYYLEDKLYISGEYKGNADIFYNGAVNVAANDDDKLDCPENLIPFLELLTAFYIWLDDDERKAHTYYQQFQEMYSSYLSSPGSTRFQGDNKPSVTIKGGVDI